MYTCKLFLKSDKIVFSGNVMRNEKKKKRKIAALVISAKQYLFMSSVLFRNNNVPLYIGKIIELRDKLYKRKNLVNNRKPRVMETIV